MALQDVGAVAPGDIPHANGLISTSCGNELSTWIKGNRPDATSMALQRLEAVTGACIPQSNSLIIAPAGKKLPVGAEGDGPHAVAMVSQNMETPARVDVPQPDRLIITATGEHMPVGAESDAPHAVGVPLACEKKCTAQHLVDPDLAGRGSYREQVPPRATRDCKGVAEGAGKDRRDEVGVGEVDIGKRHVLQVGLSYRQMGEVKTAKVTAYITQEIEHVSRQISRL